MAPSATGPRGFAGFMARIHAHPRARLLEFLVWGIPGALLVAVAAWGGRAGWLNDAIMAIAIIVGLSLIGWGLVPPRRAKVEKPVVGRRRREIAESRSRR